MGLGAGVGRPRKKVIEGGKGMSIQETTLQVHDASEKRKKVKF